MPQPKITGDPVKCATLRRGQESSEALSTSDNIDDKTPAAQEEHVMKTANSNRRERLAQGFQKLGKAARPKIVLFC
jgi:hypothetical protein